MSTKSQIKATLAGRARKLALGYRQKSFLLSPGAQERIADLAKEAGSETKALEELLVAPKLAVRSVAAGPDFAMAAAAISGSVTRDNLMETLARKGQTPDTAVKKPAPKPAAARPPAQPTRITGPLDMNGNPLPHRGPTPKQPKVKK